MKPPRLAVLHALGLALATALVFASALRGGFIYDDYWLVETNPALRAPGPLVHFLSTGLFEGTQRSDIDRWTETGRLYWRPFVKLALLVQFRAFGTRPLGYHVVSLAVHVACVLLALRWLRRRFAPASVGLPGGAHAAATGSGMVAVAAVLGAALFALHPSRVEAVAWVSGSADLWMGFWVLVGLVFWEAPGAWRAAASAAAFALAVACKESAALVPLALALDAWWGGRGTKRRVVAVAVVVAAVVAVRFVLLPAPHLGLDGGLPAAIRRALACLGLYVTRVVFPLHPSTQIGLVGADGRFDFPAWSVAAGGATLVGLVWLGVAARFASGARRVLGDLAWFFVPLLPVLQIVPLGYTTLVAERFLYLPLLGVAALAGRGLLAGIRRRPDLAPAFAGAAVIACTVSAAVTLKYVPQLRSNTTLWAYESRLQPRNPLLHLYRARAAWASGRLEEALAAARSSYDRAVHPDVRAEAALVWAELRLQVALGREQEVLAGLRDFLDAWAAGSGPAVLAVEGAPFRAEPAAARRVELSRTTSFRSARAIAHARSGSYAEAAVQLRALLPDDPSPRTATNLARVLACQERFDEALAVLGTVAAQHPRDRTIGTLGFEIRRFRDQERSAPSDAFARATARAPLWVQLGAPALARRELAPWVATHAGEPEVAIPLAFADAADGDVDAARRALEAARARDRDPSRARIWDAALADLGRWQPAAAPPRRADLEDLLR